jgi:ankyrin repeat protein
MSAPKGGKSKELYNLCWGVFFGRASFDDIQRWLKRHDQSRLIKAANYQGGNRATPLHYVVSAHPPSSLVKLLLQLAPGTIKLQDNDGNLPLHLACEHKASYDVIQLILKSYPRAAKVRNKKRELPIHLACANLLIENIPNHLACTNLLIENTLEPLDLLLSVCPESIYVKDGSGRFPSEMFKRNISQKFLLHKAICIGFSTVLIKLLLRAFPESCIQQDCEGMVPLHHACASNAPHFLEYVTLLLDNDTASSFNIKDNRGNTPLQLLSCKASIPDKNGMLPLHRVAARSKHLSEKTIRILVDAFPKSITTVDNYGMLPFHHACLNKESTHEVLMLFLSLSPEAVLPCMALRESVDMDSLNKSIQDIKKSVAAIEKKDSLSERYLNSVVAELKSEIKRLEKKTENIDTEIRCLRSEIAGVKAASEQAIEKLNSMMGSLKLLLEEKSK